MQLPCSQPDSTTDHNGENNWCNPQVLHRPKYYSSLPWHQIIHSSAENSMTCFSPDRKFLHLHFSRPLPFPSFFVKLFPNKLYPKPHNGCYWKKPSVVKSVVSSSSYKVLHTGTKAHNDKACSCPLTVAGKYQPFLPKSFCWIAFHSFPWLSFLSFKNLSIHPSWNWVSLRVIAGHHFILIASSTSILSSYFGSSWFISASSKVKDNTLLCNELTCRCNPELKISLRYFPYKFSFIFASPELSTLLNGTEQRQPRAQPSSKWFSLITHFSTWD